MGRRHRGYVLPGSEYCGPGNGLFKKSPRSFADRVCREHDKAYTKYLAQGRNPYLFYNAADERGLRLLANDKSFAGSVYKAGYKIKRAVSPTMDESPWKLPPPLPVNSPIKKRKLMLMDVDCPMPAPAARNQSNRAVQSLVTGHTPMRKNVKRQKFKDVRVVGKQSRVMSLVNQSANRVSSAANQFGWETRDVMTPVLMQNVLFTPRFFQELTKNAGAVGTATFGVTATFLNTRATDNVGLFQYPDPILTGVDQNTDIPWQANYPVASTAGNSAGKYQRSSAILTITGSQNIYFRNNYAFPCRITVYRYVAKEDHVIAETTAGANVLNRSASDYANDNSSNNYVLSNETTPTENTFANSADSGYNNLNFSFSALPKGGMLDRYYKIFRVGYAELAVGESTSISDRLKPVTCSLNQTIQRLRALNFDPSGTAGIDGKYVLGGITQGVMIRITGCLAHDGTTAVGISAAGVDVRYRTEYKFSVRGEGGLATDSRSHNFSGSADIVAEPFAPGFSV